MAPVSYNPPQESGLSKETVDRIAASVATQVGYIAGGKLRPIVEKLGGAIRIQDVLGTSDPSSGSIEIDGPRKFVIYLAAHTGPTRDRFTIAHELGHFVLHYLWPRQRGKQVGPIAAKRYGTGRVEWEANWFAAGFLMPRTAYVEASADVDGDIDLLADHFKVSLEAARIRKEALGL